MTGMLIYAAADVITAVICALLLRKFVCVIVFVQGKSMLDTLKDGEVVFVRRYRKKRLPERGDIVVCRFLPEQKLYIKRLIALPGETVSIEGDAVFINGEPMEERYPKRRNIRIMEPVQLDEDEYFVLGDNRLISRDSRKMGPVHRNGLTGYACCTLLPFRNRRKLF